MSQASSQSSFAELFARTSLRVYGYARRHTDPAAAEEIVSEVYLAAWRRRSELPDDPLPWLLSTARNLLRNHWRSRDRQARLTAELAGIAHLTTQPAVDRTVVDRDAMVRGLSTLSADERETLLLVAWDGLDRTSAAAVVGCTPATFAVRLHRARRALSRAIESNLGEPNPAMTALPVRPQLRETS
jgi:RNA polymerase sigma-70 factor (ECF subfamily)